MKKISFAICFSLLMAILVPFGHASMANTTFSDVGSTHRAQAEIYYLVKGGITSGVTPTQFSPDREVTRAEAAILLGRTLGLDGAKTNTSFPDVSSNHTASGYIKKLVERKIISGYPEGDFKPDRTLNRGEMAILISRTFNYNSNSVSVATSALLEKGISQGVADGTFGEAFKIKRADFAVFLARSINTEFRNTQTEEYNVDMFVNTNPSVTLNVRSGPNTTYPSVSKLNSGENVKYSYSVGDWSSILVDGKTGFVHSSYIQSDAPTPEPVPEPEQEPETAPEPEPEPELVPEPELELPRKKALNELVVIIDPGHGGTDSGAVGNGFLEKNMTLNISKKFKSYFDKTPIQAKLTRTDDSTLSLQARPKFARENNGDIFVSVHTNAFNKSANGQETFYYAKTAATNPHVRESRALAIYIQNRMLEAWNLTNRGVNPWGHTGNFHVLRENTMPAALAEVGFIDSAKDILKMNTEGGREKMARALFLATLDYYYYFEGRQDVLPLYNTASGQPGGKLH